MKTIISYNESEVKTDGSLEDLDNGYNVWIDMVEPKHDEIIELVLKFNLDPDAMETYFNESKKPEVRVLDNHSFTVILDIKNKDPKTLETDGIYLFLGRHWLITIHKSEVKLKEMVERLLTVKNKKIKEAQMDALYYNILAEIINRYEQLLTALELTVNEYQRKSFARPSEVVFSDIDLLSRQTVILRRQFWRVRNIINFLVHNEQDKEDVKYIEVVYDEISQLIDFVESYEDTINSIRELYVAKVSLQINDTMRVLTVFTVILLPLTLIVGIYGMNGVDLSNLESVSTGFFIVIIIMVSTAIGLLLFFIKKQWILVRPRAGGETDNLKKTAEQNNHTKNKNSNASRHVWKNG